LKTHVILSKWGSENRRLAILKSSKARSRLRTGKRTWGWEGRHVKKWGGWLCVVGILGFSAAALAQASPASTAGTRFDGTYPFVSAMKLNDTYTTPTGRMGQCPSRRPGPLTVVNGQARFRYGRQREFEIDGTVGSQGELAMRLVPTPGNKTTPGIESTVNGTIDGNGTVTARQVSRFFNYDLSWRKQSK
jgi:hypothetical protein